MEPRLNKNTQCTVGFAPCIC